MWLGNLLTLNYDAANAGELSCAGRRCLAFGPFLSIDSPPSSLLTQCRRTLATSQYLISHVPSTAINDQTEAPAPAASSSNCAHYFLDPLSWMRPELEQGKLDGRLECPKCHTNVGKYAWQGMQCSCGGWVVPGISLSKSRIDEVKSRTSAAAEIRRPPGAVSSLPSRGTAKENL